MPQSDDLTLRLKAQGARQSARDVDRTSRSVKGLGRQSNLALRSVTRLGGGLRLLAGGALALGAAGAGMALVLGKQSITAASDLNEEVNKTQVVFRGSEKNMIAWSTTASSAFGQSQQQALEAANTFGNMLVPMGFARKTASKMSKRMVVLASDMASFNNADPSETLDAIRSGLAGESEPLRKFGVFLSDARLKQEALNMGLYSGKGNLDASAKAAATYRLIIKDTGDAAGDFSRTQGGLANETRTLKAVWTDLKATMGTMLLPIVRRGLEKIITPLKHVSNAARDIFSDKNLTWQEKFQRLGRSVKHWFGPMVKDAIDAARPYINRGFEAAGPAAARALIKGFRAAPAWAQILTVGFLASKLGVFRAFGSLAGSAFCGRFTSPCFGAGSKAKWMARGTRVGAWMGPAAGLALAAGVAAGYDKLAPEVTPGKGKSHVGPIPTPGPTGGPRANPAVGLGMKLGRALGFGHDPGPTPGPTKSGNQLGPDAIIHIHTHLDGKEVAKAVTRVGTKKKATR